MSDRQKGVIYRDEIEASDGKLGLDREEEDRSGPVGPLPPPGMPPPQDWVCTQCGTRPAQFLTNQYEPLCRLHSYIRDGFSFEYALKLANQHRGDREETDIQRGRATPGSRSKGKRR